MLQVPRCLPQIRHGPARDRTLASALRGGDRNGVKVYGDECMTIYWVVVIVRFTDEIIIIIIIRREDNIRMDLQEVGLGYEDWIGLAQDRDRWRTLVCAVRNLRGP